MKKYSILMYNFNNYEIMREPEEMDPECEYIYVTDNKNLKSNKWTVIVDKDLENLSIFDKCYAVRFNLFKYVTTPICIYLDGSFQIHKSLRKLYIDFMNSESDLGLNIHPDRTTLFEEYKTWTKIRNYPKETAFKCLAYMQEAGYDIKNYKGLYQGGCRICKNTKLNKSIDNMVFNILKKLGTNSIIERLDQTVYSFVINTFYENKIKIFAFSQQVFQSKYISFCTHNTNKKKIYNKNNDKQQGWCQNKLINLYKLK